MASEIGRAQIIYRDVYEVEDRRKQGIALREYIENGKAERVTPPYLTMRRSERYPEYVGTRGILTEDRRTIS